MAVTLKADPEKGWKTLAIFKVSPALVAEAKKKGISVVTTTPGIYTVKNKVKVFGNVPVKTTVITLVENQSLGPGSIEQYKAAFEDALKKAIAATPDPDVMPGGAAMQYPAEVVVNVPAATKPETKVPSQPKPSHVPGKTKLADATALYQPVEGTSPTSTYYTFAFFPGMKMAARVNGTKLSVRAEGPGLSPYLPTLKAQFKMDEGKQGEKPYVSSHYLVDDKDLIVKTLAAIVGVVGFSKAEKVADLNQFVFGVA
jgi:hypothetical protein